MLCSVCGCSSGGLIVLLVVIMGEVDVEVGEEREVGGEGEGEQNRFNLPRYFFLHVILFSQSFSFSTDHHRSPHQQHRQTPVNLVIEAIPLCQAIV